MKARHMIGNASYGPDTLKILFKAFDDAWDILAPTISGRAGAIEASRLKLATVILSLAHNGSSDSERIKNAALQIMATPGDRT